MKWKEVQNIYPNQFVKFEILHFEEKDNHEIIDEVAVIGPVTDEDATRELLNSKVPEKYWRRCEILRRSELRRITGNSSLVRIFQVEAD